MIVTISNSQLSATISTLGAELISLVKNNKNYIWQVDETYWNKTSPVLFPIVGRLKNDSFTYNGNSYQLPRHGFARNMEFSFEKRSDSQVIFELNETEESKVNYPFDFKLFLAYTLMNNELVIEYFVRNQSDDELLFSIGAHPAFAIEGNFENHSLQFNNSDIFETNHLENESFNDKRTLVETENNTIQLNYSLFDKDALVFKHLKSNEVNLKYQDKNILKVNFDNFPYLGIWTKQNAPFLCIEPWSGLADNGNHNGNLEDKEGINHLPAGEDFLRAIRIEVLE
ncbi:aldose 1-epimerase family protein [Flavobacterium sp. F372]|uniref:Aldose 1-epimerase family protein n=1 Tax=Flavobacterium bernardetii TaxID=2813823 RepID=A0ABR7IVB0_9FLAO|nr:aldose 1-epimerase family protein [Flavobacterium bernardetii]MBC5833673.1 aldose 1-epimerase family protein [Flavobacterium bernardetii]NHF68906.1 aldose 1-epimerase family protein [Flavobacterium bernardetii]